MNLNDILKQLSCLETGEDLLSNITANPGTKKPTPKPETQPDPNSKSQSQPKPQSESESESKPQSDPKPGASASGRNGLLYNIDLLVRNTMDHRAKRDPNLDIQIALEELVSYMAFHSSIQALGFEDPIKEQIAVRWTRIHLQIQSKKQRDQKVELHRLKLQQEHDLAMREFELKLAKSQSDTPHKLPRWAIEQMERMQSPELYTGRSAVMANSKPLEESTPSEQIDPNAVSFPTQASAPANPFQPVDYVKDIKPLGQNVAPNVEVMAAQNAAKNSQDKTGITTPKEKLQGTAHVEFVNAVSRILSSKPGEKVTPSATSKGTIARHMAAA